MIIVCILSCAFSPPKRKPIRQSLEDISHQLLTKAYENPGKMQARSWKKYILYLQLSDETDSNGRYIYKVGVSRTGRNPGMDIFNRWRDQFSSVSMDIDAVDPWKEHSGNNFFIWGEFKVSMSYIH
jgi:hypothetical protein